MFKNFHHRSGYTLVEVSAVIAITGILFTLVLANYRRTSQDSVLQREASLLTSRMRLAQEYTAAGKSILRCGYYFGNLCAVPNVTDVCLSQYPPPQPQNVCGVHTSGFAQVTEGEKTPAGGYAVTLSCLSKNANGTDYGSPPPTVSATYTSYPLFYNAKKHYSLYADNLGCKFHSGPTWNDGCFPAQPHAVSMADQPTLATHDGIVTSFTWDSHPTAALFGDTKIAQYLLDASVEVKDLRLTAADTTSVSCTKKFNGTANTGLSPWIGKDPYSPPSDVVEAGYPLQAAIFFLPPDGRRTLITDNIAVSPPNLAGKPDSANPWVTAEIMLGLTKRQSDCQVIQVSSMGTVSRRIDANCDFAT